MAMAEPPIALPGIHDSDPVCVHNHSSKPHAIFTVNPGRRCFFEEKR
jgi:hypothetical protein